MVSFGRKGQTAEAEVTEAEVSAPAALPVSAPVSASLAAFPRVNLIPDEIAEEARVRGARMVLVGAVAASVAVTGGLYLMAAGQVSSAQEQLDSAQARSASLAAEATKYSDVPKVRADLQSAQIQQATALSGEVRWSVVLNNLALTMPAGTSLTSLKGTISGSPSSAAAAGSVPAVQSVLGNAGIGTLGYEGEATDFSRVAAFLEAMSKNTGLIDPFATQTASQAAAGPGVSTGGTGASNVPVQKGVTFTASATVSQKALSHRYDLKDS
jgi:Tfp pilus assembly protein PilN